MVYGFFIACLLAFVPLFTSHGMLSPRALGTMFFVWVSVFNLFVVSVFWSFMADLFDKEQGKRLFAAITAGGGGGGRCGFAAFIFRMPAVNTFLYLQQAALLDIHYPDGATRTAFLGRIELTMSIIT